MKKYIFCVALVGGMTFTQSGEGYNESDALLDACLNMQDSEYPEDDIVSIDLESVEDEA